MVKQSYYLFKRYEKPIKGQLPDIVRLYIEDHAHFPFHITLTKNKDDALMFDSKEEAKKYANLFHFEVGS
jgi:hypothetical protein